MEAATPLNLPQIRFVGDRLIVDGLQVTDDCALRLAREAHDPIGLLLDAIEIGSRILDREATGAQVDVVKAEFETLRTRVEERTRAVVERIDQRFAEKLGADDSDLSRALSRHFGDESSDAVQHKIRIAVTEVTAKMREDLRAQLMAESDDNPLAKFHRQQMIVAAEREKRQADDMRSLHQELGELRLQLERERGDKEKLDEVAAEREKGTAKGRTYEEAVFEALDAIAAGQGDVCEAVGDFSEGTGKKGDVVVAIEAREAPRAAGSSSRRRTRGSRPEALRYLDNAKAQRNADFAVLVVPGEDKIPSQMVPLREYNGDKLIVSFDPEDEFALALQVAYSLARARVMLTKGAGDGIDGGAVQEAAERALQSMEDVRRIKQNLTASKTSIDKATEIVDEMAAGVSRPARRDPAPACGFSGSARL